jgi:S1-C subfamily serine protease
MKLRLARVLSAIVVVGCQGASSTPSSAQSSRIETTNTAVSASRRTAITEAVARVAPSVVTVQVQQSSSGSSGVLSSSSVAGPAARQRTRLGIHRPPDGAVVTNAHVVAERRHPAAMKDGTNYPARPLALTTNDSPFSKSTRAISLWRLDRRAIC